MECLYFSDFIQASKERSDANRIFIDKFTTRSTCYSAGLSTPRVIQVFPKVDDIDFSKLPNKIVLKHPDLAATRGVFVLQKVEGGYIEYIRRLLLSEREIVQRLSDA